MRRVRRDSQVPSHARAVHHHHACRANAQSVATAPHVLTVTPHHHRPPAQLDHVPARRARSERVAQHGCPAVSREDESSARQVRNMRCGYTHAAPDVCRFVHDSTALARVQIVHGVQVQRRRKDFLSEAVTGNAVAFGRVARQFSARRAVPALE